jgi:hypothetical protein
MYVQTNGSSTLEKNGRVFPFFFIILIPHSRLQDLFQATAASLNIDPLKDSLLQRALTCVCYRLLDHISSDWAVVAPVLLGSLRPIAESLPPGLGLSDVYPDPRAPSLSPSRSPSSDADPDVHADPRHHVQPVAPPPLLNDVYALRKALVDAKNIPPSCANTIDHAIDRLTEERSNFQEKYDASQDIRDLAQRRFQAAHVALSTELLMADVKLMERQANFDRLVLLLRGESFFTHDIFFDVDSESASHHESYYDWRRSVSPALYEMLMEWE